MRKLITAALAGATVAGGAMLVQAAQAQPYYYGPPAHGYSPYYAQPYASPYGYPGYGGRYPYPGGYGGYGGGGYYGTQSGLGSALAVLGSVLGLGYPSSFYSGVPVDQYGPDPNGMIGPDGRRIKCKLRRTYDRYYGGSVIRRECWSR